MDWSGAHTGLAAVLAAFVCLACLSDAWALIRAHHFNCSFKSFATAFWRALVVREQRRKELRSIRRLLVMIAFQLAVTLAPLIVQASTTESVDDRWVVAACLMGMLMALGLREFRAPYYSLPITSAGFAVHVNWPHRNRGSWFSRDAFAAPFYRRLMHRAVARYRKGRHVELLRYEIGRLNAIDGAGTAALRLLNSRPVFSAIESRERGYFYKIDQTDALEVASHLLHFFGYDLRRVEAEVRGLVESESAQASARGTASARHHPLRMRVRHLVRVGIPPYSTSDPMESHLEHQVVDESPTGMMLKARGQPVRVGDLVTVSRDQEQVRASIVRKQVRGQSILFAISFEDRPPPRLMQYGSCSPWPVA